MTNPTTLLSIALTVGIAGQGIAQEPTSESKAEVVELSGILRRPVKWVPQLEIVPSGVIQRIDLDGKLVEGGRTAGLKDGQAIKVWGVVRTRLHRGGTAENPSPFPPQWMISLEVTKVQKLDDAMDVLKEAPN